ncbi:ATP-binding cassette domain-containing protein [Paenibacillus thermoaerophilus]|uniref:ATP-binding cassette domain-containing protein n=1 Tax=Paenibacillus thermoaerophilus TaxID=1215385 RepID=A0ABW2V8S8_9BACL|nr:ATP-binding cassette domain-containing protein [Paenibacillus thermoaerophilus]TMV17890.1 ATP-binding cassette domain-containing protein [Paenibacillus thermoaerophilus]
MREAIVIRNLRLSAGPRMVLDGISHTFQPGTLTLIAGRCGSGKTMLLETVSGLREPDSGDIAVGGRPLWLGSGRRRKLNREAALKLGVAPQHPETQWFAASVREEFRYSLRPCRLSAVERDERTARAVSGSFGGETERWLARSPFALSGGQQRRLASALLQAVDPAWMLLDEPTAGLDRQAIESLRADIARWIADGRGVIAVTHDPETLWERADRILILDGGRIVWNGTPAELADRPEALEQAGLALPERLRTLRLLREAGIPLPNGKPDAAGIAAAIAEALAVPRAAALGGALHPGQRLAASSDRFGREAPPAPAVPEAAGTEQPEAEQSERPAHEDGASPSPLLRLDPRAVWLAYMLITPGILIQSHGIGWLLSLGAAALTLRFSRVPASVWLKPAIGLTVFTFIAAAFAGLTFGEPSANHPADENGPVWPLLPGVAFAAGPAAAMLFRFSQLVMIMVVGLALMSGIRPLRLKRALEQGLGPLKLLRLPVDAFAMTAALMMRFIPVLQEEWHRFARIAAARGKYAARPGRVPPGEIRSVAVPYLMSLLRLGDTLSQTLIARGVGRAGVGPTHSYRLKFGRADYGLVAAAAAMLLAFLLAERLLR